MQKSTKRILDHLGYTFWRLRTPQKIISIDHTLFFVIHPEILIIADSTRLDKETIRGFIFSLFKSLNMNSKVKEVSSIDDSLNLIADISTLLEFSEKKYEIDKPVKNYLSFPSVEKICENPSNKHEVYLRLKEYKEW
tara:strand:- start:109384 stop:109794 length:411 start_codon:yes stop_codon:yes gene_type:complete